MTKRILAVALAVMMLLIVAFPASAAITVSKVEIRGAVSNNSTLMNWNALNFPGFYYDIKNDRSTEHLNFLVTPSRTIPENGLQYLTGKTGVDFKVNEKEGLYVHNISSVSQTQYHVVGWQAEKWIAVNNVTAKIAKLALEMDKEDKKTLTTGETWSLGAGYELNINAIDARTTPRQVWFTLKKDGAIIDEGIGQAPGSSGKQPAVYYKTKTIIGESDALLFTVYIDNIFSGATSDMVQFKYAWLIDETTAKEIKSGDKYGVFEVADLANDQINLTNKNTVSLSRNSETTLMGDMKFNIADSAVLRFYPKVDYVILQSDGTVPTSTEGTPGVTPKATPKNETNKTATPTVEKTVTVTEAPTTVATPKPPVATTPTEPGFEMAFAIAGLLAVAFLVLRQRK